MEGTNQNAPMTNHIEMSEDQIDMNTFVGDEPQEVAMADTSSRLWCCLTCLRCGIKSKYFNATTKDVASRLKYTLYGHFTGMERPFFNNEQVYQDLAVQSQDQIEKPDFDLCVPIWLFCILVVEYSIISPLNPYTNAYFAGDYDTNDHLNLHFSALDSLEIFIFLGLFVWYPPLMVYVFLLKRSHDGTPKFWRIFAAFGYSFVSYVPAILLTLTGVNTVKLIVIGVACINQLIFLNKQSDLLEPSSGPPEASNNNNAVRKLSPEERAKEVLCLRFTFGAYLLLLGSLQKILFFR